MTMEMHATEARAFANCRTKWLFSSRNGMNYTPNLPPIPLFIGRIFHKAVEGWHKSQLGKGDDWDRGQAAVKGMTALEEEANAIFENRHFVEAMSHLNKSDEYATAVDLATGLFEEFSSWAQGRWTVIAAEKKFDVALRTPKKFKARCRLKGTVDAIVHYKGSPWLLEVKTAAASERYAKKPELVLDLQMGAYLWAMRELNDYPKGVIRLTVFKSLPKMPKLTTKGILSRAKITTTYTQTMRAIEYHGLDPADYGERLAELRHLPHPCFNISLFQYTDTELRIIEERLYKIYREMVRGATYPNEGRGCRWCSFVEPCVYLNRGLDYYYALQEEFHKNERD